MRSNGSASRQTRWMVAAGRPMTVAMARVDDSPISLYAETKTAAVARMLSAMCRPRTSRGPPVGRLAARSSRLALVADAVSRGSAWYQDRASESEPLTLAEYVTQYPKIFVR